MTKPRGRRAGTSDTRETVARVARAQFAERGYARTTIRGIAAEAGVDPALVMHFFGSKQALFVNGITFPVEPKDLMGEIQSAPVSERGRRLAAFIVASLEHAEFREPLVGVLRSVMTEPEVAVSVRDVVERRIITPTSSVLSGPWSELRATLLWTQIVGFVTGCYVLKVEPFASSDRAVLTDLFASTLQPLLEGPDSLP